MQITVINVGYGDAILIEQDGFTMLLDGGTAREDEFSGFPYRVRAADYLEAAGVSRIDLLIISHIHDDHVCGLEALRVPVGRVLIPFDPALFAGRELPVCGPDAPRSAYLFTDALGAFCRLLRRWEAAGVPVGELSAGDVHELPGGLRLEALAPERGTKRAFLALLKQAFTAADPTQQLAALDRTSNASSLLLRLTAQGCTALLAADSVPAGWAHLDPSVFKNVNVLKLPHHAQRDCISEEIMRVMPLDAVVTTASSDRRYGSAAPEVYDALRRMRPDVQLLFTDERDYPPYFSQPEGFRAIRLTMDSGGLRTDFIK